MAEPITIEITSPWPSPAPQTLPALVAVYRERLRFHQAGMTPEEVDKDPDWLEREINKAVDRAAASNRYESYRGHLTVLAALVFQEIERVDRVIQAEANAGRRPDAPQLPLSGGAA